METTTPQLGPEAASHLGIPVEHSEAIPIEPAPKVKRRTRLLHGLQRISSSPSLAPQLGLNRTAGNQYSARALSCVSLSSPTSPRNYNNSYSSQSSGQGYSTAPTSVSSTPGPDTPVFDGSYDEMAIRRVEGAVALGISAPRSALPPDARPMSRGVPSSSEQSGMPEILEDHFSGPFAILKPARRANIDFWDEMPQEIKLSIFSYLTPKQLVRASIVCKRFYEICFDGQLWTRLDASEFYKDIPAESLAKIIVAAGPFVKDLNLRGCMQVEHYKRAEVIVGSCRNLINATLEGCRNFQRSTLHSLLRTNQSLASLNLTGLNAVNNSTCKIIAQSCPSLEVFNVSWCTRMDARGIKAVVLGCPNLRDLRAGEITGFNDTELAQVIFETNKLERLLLNGCVSITDEALNIMIAGTDPEIDILTDIPVVPVRKLRHLDLSRCTQLTSVGVKSLAHLVPDLEGLRLTGCTALTDSALSDLFATTPRLTHLDMEELAGLTNSLLSDHLAKSPCAPFLEHLSISYCEHLGDTGMLPVIRACTNLQSVDMDNTRISDLVLSEAAAMVRTRCQRTSNKLSRPRISLLLVAFDCQNVTWAGVSEVLSRNSEITKPSGWGAVTYPVEIIALRCFYGWQMTVDEHLRRVLKGDLPAASRLGRKWRDYMMASEEVGVGGAGIRRRRRRAREAQMLHADEEEGGIGMDGIGRRRRARSNGCQIM
jgi:F-box/leucine-rich repeat protein 2/20